jgi:calcineurin-like phosphoesterase family protein
MNVDLVSRAAALVEPNDDLWHLGDVALGYLDSSLTNLARVPGQVTLVAGNHDRCHPYNGARAERFVEVYRERCGLSRLLLTNSRLTLPNGADVQISHFPYSNGENMGDKFARWRPVDDGSWLLCGHVHERWRQQGRTINVGLNAWAGMPVSEDTIIELIETGPQDLAPMRWQPWAVSGGLRQRACRRGPAAVSYPRGPLPTEHIRRALPAEARSMWTRR